MTSRIASKVSEANMKVSPRMLMLTSPYEAIAVPKAISTTAAISRLEGSSRRATNSANMVMTGVNACVHRVSEHLCTCNKNQTSHQSSLRVVSRETLDREYFGRL